MNRNHITAWNSALDAQVITSELAKSKGKSSRDGQHCASICSVNRISRIAVATLTFYAGTAGAQNVVCTTTTDNQLTALGGVFGGVPVPSFVTSTNKPYITDLSCKLQQVNASGNNATNTGANGTANGDGSTNTGAGGNADGNNATNTGANGTASGDSATNTGTGGNADGNNATNTG
ncbi:ESPR-type extended signal peptide-containing protein, partial [Burkholderia ubonensis]|uniref:ESPR-type extended signal peptide-containing protein n=1 Tax=Burkholderia ubonensis TaxID=101571 RepID=UPI0022B76AA3